MRLNRTVLLAGASALAIMTALPMTAQAANEFTSGVTNFNHGQAWAAVVAGVPNQQDPIVVNATGGIYVGQGDEIGAVTLGAGGDSKMVMFMLSNDATGADNAVTIASITGDESSVNTLTVIFAAEPFPDVSKISTFTVNGDVDLRGVEDQGQIHVSSTSLWEQHDVVLDLKGNVDADFILLNESGGGTATVRFTGTVAQMVNSDIDGNNGGNLRGEVIVDNAAGVTFDDDITDVNIVRIYDGSTAIFTDDVVINELVGAGTDRGGDVTFQDDTRVLGNVKLGTLTLYSDSDDDLEFGDSSTDTFDVTGLAVTAGNGDGISVFIGGELGGGTAEIGAGGITITGGNADGGAGGGNATVHFLKDTVTLAGDVGVAAGTESDDYLGGTAELIFHGDVSGAARTITVDGGTGDDGDAHAMITFKGDVTMDKIVLMGAADVRFTGSGNQTVSGAIEGGADEHGNVVVNSGGSVTFNNAIGGGEDDAVAVNYVKVHGGTATFEGTVRSDDIRIGYWEDEPDYVGAATAVFKDGVFTGDDLSIINGATATFEGAVSIGDDLVINEASTATFADSVTVEDVLSIDGGSIISFAKDLSAAYIVIDDGDDVSVVTFDGDEAQEIDARIYADGSNGKGKIFVANTSGATFKRAIGEVEGYGIGEFQVGAGAEATLEADLAATDILIGEDATLTFKGEAIAGDVDNIGTFETTFGDVGIIGNLANSGTVKLGAKTLTIDGGLTLKNGGAVTATITDTERGGIVVSGELTLGTGEGQKTSVTLATSGGAVRNGVTYDFISAGSINTEHNSVASFFDVLNASTSLVSWSAVQDENDVVILASVKSAAAVSGVVKNSVPAVDAVNNYNGANAGLNALGAALQALTDDSAVNKAGAQLRTDASGAVASASSTATNQVLSLVGGRSGDVRTASAASGVATGEAMRGMGLWGQAYGTTGTQKQRQAADGFDVDTVGLALGADAKVADAVRVGLSYAFGDTDVKNKDLTAGNKTEVESHTATLYGTYTGTPWYVDGMAAYSRHNYDTSRIVDILGTNPKGSFSGNQYTARLEGGYPVAATKQVSVTPFVRTTYSHLSLDAYTETGGGVADLTVGSQSYNTLQIGVGGRVNGDIDAGNGMKVQPELRLFYGYDAVADRVRSTQAFTAGGAAFAIEGPKPARNSLNLGLGLGLLTADNVTVSADYDAELRDKYLGHTGKLNLRAEF